MKVLKNINKIYYILLLVSVIIYILPPRLKIGGYFLNPLGYFLLGLIILALISLLVVLIMNFKKYYFFSGIKESSLNIFSLLLCVIVCFYVTKTYKKEANKIVITFVSKTPIGISNITFFGRNDEVSIDTLAPFKSKTLNFYGKNAKSGLKNDFENEIDLRFYYEKKTREKKVVKGFSRGLVLPDSIKVSIYSKDSILIESY